MGTNGATLSIGPDFSISESLSVLSGTIELDTPPDISVTANGHPCVFRLSRWRTMDRAQKRFVFDFDTVVQLQTDAGLGDSLQLQVSNRGKSLLCQAIRLSPDLGANLAAVAQSKADTRQWLLSRFKCPECEMPGPPRAVGGNYECQTCGAVFRQNTEALRILPTALETTFSHEIPKQISWHEYAVGILDKIQTICSGGGKVLDFGAGFKTRHIDGLIGLEIIDYPCVDLIASGDRLPIQDDSFDLIVCMSVLEHVRDPFGCGREIERVLKPGGELYCVVPFIFPVHAHPHHYYNMTFAGVQNLFSEKMQTAGTRYGHPILALRQIALEYFKGLPESGRLRDTFGAMTMADLINGTPAELEVQPVAVELNEKARADLAQGTHTWFRKMS